MLPQVSFAEVLEGAVNYRVEASVVRFVIVIASQKVLETEILSLSLS